MQYSRECVLASIPTIGNKNPCVQKIPNYWRWLMLTLSHIHFNEWNIWVKLFECSRTQKNQLQSISSKYFMHLPTILKRATGTHNGIHFSTRPNNKGESRIAATSKIEHFVIIVNGGKPLTIITKCSTLNVAAVLDPFLKQMFKRYLMSYDREWGRVAWVKNISLKENSYVFL